MKPVLVLLGVGTIACLGFPSAAQAASSRDFDPEIELDLFDEPESFPMGDDSESVAPPAVRGLEAPASSAVPKVLWLWYADGGPLPVPTSSPSCMGKTPPAFRCTFASSKEDCMRQVAAQLDRLYADFNIIFTHTRPTAAPFYTVAITDGGGAWCGRAPSALGISPIRTDCGDYNGDMAFTFSCSNPTLCAVITAQEHGHLVGLLHSGQGDVMAGQVGGTETFRDQNLAVNHPGLSCRSVQNSYQLLKDRLDAWPGGTKPDPGPTGGGGAAGGGGGGGGSGGGGSGGGSGGAGGQGGGGAGGSSGPGGSGGSTGGQGGENRASDVTGGCAMLQNPGSPQTSFLLPLLLLSRMLVRTRRATRSSSPR